MILNYLKEYIIENINTFWDSECLRHDVKSSITYIYHT